MKRQTRIRVLMGILAVGSAFSGVSHGEGASKASPHSIRVLAMPVPDGPDPQSALNRVYPRYEREGTSVPKKSLIDLLDPKKPLLIHPVYKAFMAAVPTGVGVGLYLFTPPVHSPTDLFPVEKIRKYRKAAKVSTVAGAALLAYSWYQLQEVRKVSDRPAKDGAVGPVGNGSTSDQKQIQKALSDAGVK